MGLRVGDRLPVEEGPAVTVGEALLAPHLSYLAPIAGLLEHPGLHALAHVTGGGLTDNLPRSLPAGARARVRLGAWRVPAIFRLLEERGAVTAAEMRRVFNLGIGMVLVVAEEAHAEVREHLRAHGQEPVELGEVLAGGSGVEYVERP